MIHVFFERTREDDDIVEKHYKYLPASAAESNIRRTLEPWLAHSLSRKARTCICSLLYLKLSYLYVGSPGATGISQRPYLQSMLLKTVASPGDSMQSSTEEREYTSERVNVVSFQWRTQMQIVPLLFGTRSTGEDHLLVVAMMTPSSSCLPISVVKSTNRA